MCDAPIRVLVIDDVRMAGDALDATLRSTRELTSLGRHSVREPGLLATIAIGRPHVVVVDADPAENEVGRLVRDVLRAAPNAQVVMCGGRPDEGTVVAAAEAGASAWCDRTISAAELIDVIAGVHRGEAWFPPDLLGAVLRRLTARDSADPPQPDTAMGLSARESEVFSLLARGASTEEIARELALSTNTVRNYARRVMSKLGAYRLSAGTPAEKAHLAAARGRGTHPIDVVASLREEDHDASASP